MPAPDGGPISAADTGALAVARWWTPEEFAGIEEEAWAWDSGTWAAGPLVRSSYRAAEAFPEAEEDKPGP
jgi:lipoate synthase